MTTRGVSIIIVLLWDGTIVSKGYRKQVNGGIGIVERMELCAMDLGGVVQYRRQVLCL